jgi:hypothetical protein
MDRPVECSFTPTCRCFGCHARSINFAASCTPTRRPETVRTNAREARWQRDIPAYTSLVKNGVQPRTIDGCGDVALSDAEKFEITTGIAVPGRAAKQATKDALVALGHADLV